MVRGLLSSTAVWGLISIVVLAACGGQVRPHPVACAPERIGRVAITGVPAEVVAPLAILEGTLDDPERMQRMTALTQGVLVAQGYARATVELSRTTTRTCGIDVAVAVTLGPRYRIARIELDAPDDFPDDVRRALIASDFGAANAVDGAYRADRMKAAMSRLVAAYWDRGWVNAELGGEPRAVLDDARAEVTLHLPIRAGRRFRIREVRLRTRDPVGAQAIAALGIHGGDWYETPRLRDALERASRHVGRKLELWPAILADRGEIDLEVEVIE